MVNSAVLECVLRATTKKRSSTFFEKKVHSQTKSGVLRSYRNRL